MLRLAVVLTRHGDRTPLKIFPNTIAKWPEGLGVLTHIGAKQHYELGTKYRKRYIDDYNLISPYYNDSEIYVRSTAKQRTLTSAYSFMNGLFPPNSSNNTGLPYNIQHFPVYSENLKDDKLLYAYKHNNEIDELQKIERKKEHWVSLERNNKEILEDISKIIGTNISIKQCSTIWNNINAERIHNKPSIPELVNNSKIIDFIKEHSKFALKYKYGTQEIGRLAIGNLLTNIYFRFINKLEEPYHMSPNFVLFSGHDSILLSLFAAMGITDYDIPHYASSFTFELFQDKEKTFVQLFYNHKPLYIPICNGYTCSLNNFKELVEKSSHSQYLQDYDHFNINKHDEL